MDSKQKIQTNEYTANIYKSNQFALSKDPWINIKWAFSEQTGRRSVENEGVRIDLIICQTTRKNVRNQERNEEEEENKPKPIS